MSWGNWRTIENEYCARCCFGKQKQNGYYDCCFGNSPDVDYGCVSFRQK